MPGFHVILRENVEEKVRLRRGLRSAGLLETEVMSMLNCCELFESFLLGLPPCLPRSLLLFEVFLM